MGKRTAPATDPKIAIGYLRVSTDEQALGPEAQRGAIERWAAAHGVTVAAWHVDQGVSGGAALEKRPALMAAIASLEAHNAGLLVVAKRDRLARDVMLAAMIESLAKRQGARVASAAGEGEGDENDPAALLMRRMVDAFAEYERALIRARTRAALAVKKDRGERAGTVPFGFRLAADGSHVEPDETEQTTIARVRELRANGASIRGIVAELARAGVVGRTGRPFCKGSVENLLRKESAAA